MGDPHAGQFCKLSKAIMVDTVELFRLVCYFNSCLYVYYVIIAPLVDIMFVNSAL